MKCLSSQVCCQYRVVCSEPIAESSSIFIVCQSLGKYNCLCYIIQVCKRFQIQLLKAPKAGRGCAEPRCLLCYCVLLAMCKFPCSLCTKLCIILQKEKAQTKERPNVTFMYLVQGISIHQTHNANKTQQHSYLKPEKGAKEQQIFGMLQLHLCFINNNRILFSKLF